MFFYEQISLSLFFLVSTQIILYMVLIKDYRRITGTNMGPKIGTILETSYLKYKNDNFNIDKIIIFIDLHCIGCERVIKSLQKVGTNFKNISIITGGSAEEIRTWKENKNIMLDIENINISVINRYYNINAFPYYIKMTHEKVSEKGLLNEISVIKLYNEVEK
ncbi:MAG: hypothetical protein E6Z86_16645 [Clostridium butyricum]|nr:hypothetical protein [Clostridium butyricum]MDU5821658.1 hypothetical protein [Clostridium butyricum]